MERGFKRGNNLNCSLRGDGEFWIFSSWRSIFNFTSPLGPTAWNVYNKMSAHKQKFQFKHILRFLLFKIPIWIIQFPPQLTFFPGKIKTYNYTIYIMKFHGILYVHHIVDLKCFQNKFTHVKCHLIIGWLLERIELNSNRINSSIKPYLEACIYLFISYTHSFMYDIHIIFNDNSSVC